MRRCLTRKIMGESALKGISIALEIFCMVVNVPLIFYCMMERGEKDSRTKLLLGMLLANFLVLLCDCMTWILDGKPEYTILLYVLNFLVYSLGYVIAVVFTYYLIECIDLKQEISRRIAHFVAGFAVVSIVLVLISLYNHMYFSIQNGVYVRGSFYWLSQVYSVSVLLIDMFFILKYHKVLGLIETVSLLSYGIIPLIMIIIQVMFYGLTLIYLATTLSILIIYIGVHIEQVKQMKKQEAELAEIKLSVLFSQIQPHFLYNSLTAISYLCDKDPQAAKKALVDFAHYMRGNLDSIKSRELIPFKNELQHTEKFLKLEKLRFEDRLDIIYDIKEEDFLCPALTLQLVVENAVKYGICTREEGGVITVSTERKGNMVVITVKDNGIGMNIPSMDDIPRQDDGRTHVGLKNVRYRVRIMTGGDVQLVSKYGEGTTVTITIPKGGRT